ncbi:NADH-dependent flavin oxidoreductase [Moraxella nasicaprae]|uniref:NADH-dependent flavin oxidoreductase n=1 Tax=Moraxella nasicaprae TaxID=2904122 RepID=A0ABY6F3F1_9GAMM|nr:NADH-dependent flavin oxidoreductase [Moraxella nasicaprae]UXZ04430.1 NADH-dependent flavin oxidoreductase [Moraxella nasicaprae]
MSNLFTPLTLNNGVTIKNRLVVAPMTHLGSNPDGTLGEQERTFISNRGENMGMFITAATLVADSGKAFFGQPSALDETHLASLTETAKILTNQGTKAILQIHHGGIHAIKDLNGKDKISASPHDESGTREASVAEIHELIQAFANATDLAIRAGFDGVEIHGANAYLIQQFFSREFNHRTDEWGGNLENRLRFPLAIVDAVCAVREKHGKSDFIIGYRFSPEEAGDKGLTMADTFDLIDNLVDKPLQYLHISLWDFYNKARRGADETKTRIEQIHARIGGKLPLIGVGNLLTGEAIEQAFATGFCELLALGKAVMLNPNIATLLQEQRYGDIESEFDPERADHYGYPDLLWQYNCDGGNWLPPVKGKPHTPLNV